MELLLLLIKLLIKSSQSGKGPSPEEQRAIEAQRREWEARRQAWEAQQILQQSPAVQLPNAPALAAVRGGRAVKLPKPPPLPASVRRPPRQSPALQAARPAPATQAAPSTAVASTADASAIARWARPSTLRSQFVLTEILRPPVALRAPRY